MVCLIFNSKHMWADKATKHTSQIGDTICFLDCSFFMKIKKSHANIKVWYTTLVRKVKNEQLSNCLLLWFVCQLIEMKRQLPLSEVQLLSILRIQN